MTCEELNRYLLEMCMVGHENDEVMILLNEKSIGANAASGIESACAGFDWDAGRILLTPSRRLVSDMMSRDLPKVKILWHGVIHCPTCERKVSKKAQYCESCGQKLADLIKDLDAE